MTLFKPGDKVVVVALDGYKEEDFYLGRVLTVDRVVGYDKDCTCLTFEEASGGPFAHKFRHWPLPPTKMDDTEYNDIMAYDDLVNG